MSEGVRRRDQPDALEQLALYAKTTFIEMPRDGCQDRHDRTSAAM